MVANQTQTMKPLFLASNSPRRVALLSHLGLTFEVRAPLIREKTISKGTDDKIKEIVHENALQKALSILSTVDYGFIISGDTLVVTDENLVLGKPTTSEDAY